MPNSQENLSTSSSREGRRLTPEAQTHIDQSLSALVNIVVDNCDHQIFFDQTRVTIIGDPKIFSNYLDLLRSAIINPIPATEGQNAYQTPHGCLDSWNDIYRAVFLPPKEPQPTIDSVQSDKECSLTISRINRSTFNINYSLIDRDFGSTPQNNNVIGRFVDPKNIPTRRHLMEKSPDNSSRYKKLADINIKISGGSDLSVALKLYSVDSICFCRKCFQLPVPIVLDENTEIICRDACQYLSTLNISPPNSETKLISPKLP